MAKPLEERFKEREFVERLERASSFLPDADRVLFDMRVSQGMTLKSLSDLTGESPDHISRKVNRIITRIGSPGYRFVVLYGEAINPGLLSIAKAIFIHGLSLRDTADLYGVSLHRVREAKVSLDALIQFERDRA